MKVVVFDLDDTLYKEIEFVKNGFNSVSDYLSKKFKLNKKKIYKRCVFLEKKTW